MLSTMLRIILTLQLVTSFGAYVSALPITSKPIEGTAEQMAWKAWIMLPPEQKKLEKSRKVTPKSIFTLPNRSCPPGHQLFQSNCIPIVNIDENKLLTEQILGIVVEEPNANNSFDYDYDDIGTEIADFIYEQAEKLSGGGGGGSGADQINRDHFQYDQLPSQDQPLKFNIFQQKFPTDYETDSTMPSDEPSQEQQLKNTTQNATELKNSTIPLAKTVNVLPIKELNATLSNSTASSMDLQTESSNVSVSFASKNSGSDIGKPRPSAADQQFSVSDIDAIILPAVPTHNSNLEPNRQNLHRVSLFKDDSSVQLVTSTLLAERDVDQQQKQPDLSLLLKADDLLPLPNIASETDDVGSSAGAAAAAARDKATTARTRTSSIYVDNDVSTLSTVITNVDDTTTPLSGNIVDDSIAVEGGEFTTQFPTQLNDGIYENNEKVAADQVPTKHDHHHLKKGEHPRSVKTKNETSELTAPQEEKFTTTTEPDVTTTNFQLDETTVDEVHDAPTIALKELLELAQHRSDQTQENLGMVVKKSKVEPVEIPPIVLYIEPETTSSVMTASTRSAPISTSTSTSTPATTLIATDDGEVSPPPSTFVLESQTPSSVAKNDRFDNQQLDNSTKVNLNLPDDDDDNDDDGERQRNTSPNDERRVDSNFRNTKTEKTTTTKTPTSEIDIKQELRMINELVKGNNNNNKRKEQSKLGIIKTERSSTTESRLTTGVEKSTKVNSDKNVESITKDTTSKQQEDESTITTTVKTTSTPMTTEATVATDTRTATTTTATMWTKIVPIFNFSTSENTTPSQSTENMPSETSSTIAASTAAATSPGPTKSVSNDAINARINRSDRNSKIFRINTLDTPSFSDSDSDSNSNSKTNKNHADKQISSKTTIPITTIRTTTESTESTDNSSETTSSSINSNNGNNPFWWLPIGWRLDRPSDVSNEPSLLLRLWSAFPTSESTSKLRN